MKEEELQNQVKEELLTALLDGLHKIVLVRSTNSVTGEQEQLRSFIEDQEATIRSTS